MRSKFYCAVQFPSSVQRVQYRSYKSFSDSFCSRAIILLSSTVLVSRLARKHLTFSCALRIFSRLRRAAHVHTDFTAFQKPHTDAAPMRILIFVAIIICPSFFVVRIYYFPANEFSAAAAVAARISSGTELCVWANVQLWELDPLVFPSFLANFACSISDSHDFAEPYLRPVYNSCNTVSCITRRWPGPPCASTEIIFFRAV